MYITILMALEMDVIKMNVFQSMKHLSVVYLCSDSIKCGLLLANFKLYTHCPNNDQKTSQILSGPFILQ